MQHPPAEALAVLAAQAAVSGHPTPESTSRPLLPSRVYRDLIDIEHHALRTEVEVSAMVGRMQEMVDRVASIREQIATFNEG
ncbi:hypothetical protein Dda_0133 [Drechslerella dactyloides]|uniref:Uncharacterized protein n=1 Tax=Drechslerella dactyloides TaxID=74499 RepID=A0AAD6NMF5_DREDA|nr:hypothetical protein Dda_0133 [Drechslerella dactyloides]